MTSKKRTSWALKFGHVLFLALTLTNPTTALLQESAASSDLTLYEGFVASRARLLNNSDTTHRQLMCRTAHIASENLNSIKLVVQNYYIITPSLGASSTESWAVEYEGTSTRVTFSGANSVTVLDQGAATSDYISVNIPAGAVFWTRSYYTNPKGILYNAWQSSALSESCAYAVSGLSDQTLSTGAVMGGTSASYSHPPLAIVGHTTNPSVLIIGDSRTSNLNCVGSIETDCDGKQGNIAPSMGNVPFVNVAYFGEEANGWRPGPRSVLFPYGSQVVVELSINDLGCGFPSGDTSHCDPRNPAYGFSVAQISSAIAKIFSECSAPKKYATVPEPFTASTDGWRTTTNQSTAWAGSGVGIVTNRLAWGAYVRSGSIPGQTGYYDLARVAESSPNSGLWSVTPPPPHTSDGLHGANSYQTFLKNSGVVLPASYP
jgi:hypothetical protein